MPELKDRIKDALNNLVTLEIITTVGGIKKEDNKFVPDFDFATAKVMLTRINLLQGDITTTINEAFVSGPLAPLRDFHEAKVKEGYGIVQKNLEALKSLAELAGSDIFKH